MVHMKSFIRACGKLLVLFGDSEVSYLLDSNSILGVYDYSVVRTFSRTS